MLKKLLFLGLLISISINFNYVFAEANLIIPVKKPSLTDEEIKVKISKNILKPLKKPKKIEITAIKENKIVEVLLHIPGGQLVIKKEAATFEAAIDDGAHSLRRRLK